MSYKINQTDGTLLVDLIDGSIDTTTTDITLVGRNYSGYGESFNENFIKIMENFAATSAPANPLRGQIWYDTSVGRLKVWDGEQFRGTDTTTYSAIQPNTLAAGDLWIDATNKQLYFSDGAVSFLVGPSYTRSQTKTEYDAVTILDSFGFEKTVGRWSVGNTTVALITNEAFTAANIDSNVQFLTGWTAPFVFLQGVNTNPTYSDFKWNGTATNANNLISGGDVYAPNSFVQVTPNLPIATYQTTNQHLHINNDRGLLVGDVSRASISTDTTSTNRDIIFGGLRNDAGIRIQVTASDTARDAITIDNQNSRVGIFQSAPAYNLDVTGDLRVTGDLLIEGTQTSLDVTTLRVEDKQIELGITDGSTLLTDAQADDGGIVLRASGVEKQITWKQATNAWTSSVNFDLADGYSYRINGTEILNINELGASVITASGLTTIGTLQELNVDNFNFNASTMTVNSDLAMDINGNIVMTGTTQIKNIATPSDNNDAATKQYVDQVSRNIDVAFSVDSTGLDNLQLADLIDDIIPATTKSNGVNARVHCTSYSGTNTYNAADGVSKSFVAVDSAGVQNQSVISDFGFSNTTDNITLTVTRTLKRFEVVAGAWVWQEDLTSSV